MSNQSTTILLVEDDPGRARLVMGALSRAREDFSVNWQNSLSTGLDQLRSQFFDAVLLDLTLPDSQGVSTVIAMAQQSLDTPIVVLTSLESNEVAKQALDQGAQDYLVKELIVGGGTELVARAPRHAIFRNRGQMETRRLLFKLRQSQQLLERKTVRLARLCKTAQRFVDDISHEFRTPLTVIREYSSLMRDAVVGPVSADQRHFLNVVMDRTDDLGRMVDDMLDLSKLRAGLLAVRRRTCQVPEIICSVERSLKLKAAVKNVTLDVILDQDLPAVYCDPDKAEHVLINLGVNAIKNCGAPGHVKIWARASKSNEVVVAVTDNGPGINAKQQEKIFRRFRQLKRPTSDSTKGFGLGLNIAKELVSLNLGQIFLESQPGAGSTFSFTLPTVVPEEIVRRYLSTLQQRNRHGTAIAVVVAETRDPVDCDSADALDSFLSYILRPSDLLLRLDESRWAMLLVTDLEGAIRFRRRADKLLRQTNRNCPHGALPDYVLHDASHWEVPDQIPDLLIQVEALTNSAMCTV